MVFLRSMSIHIVSGFREHFTDLVEQAGQELGVEMLPAVRDYLVTLLEYHVQTPNLFPEEVNEAGQRQPTTLAELWLLAQSGEEASRGHRLRTLGDRALYISGYFSDSLQRKIVDIDYYIQMGESAFDSLSSLSKIDTQKRVYRLLADRFPSWVDTLSLVSQRSFSQSNSGLLRLYEKYLKTGSELAYSQLVERGVVTLSQDQLKKAKQDE